ncbi:hypothetical protein C1N74_13310 [Microbacterium sp. SGAir0570]|uniref:hypothetical protein n=1 Tax=Microbacterium sp. SGAir0570 TaxID=2070348 RepID=UPI0010CD122B|nr:hypothetical protein [Microbacterium sp. SGAir0570]QCR41295.1 hypothetical protein C1N74_13310 [Microbacterium sp. SGAir0570]
MSDVRRRLRRLSGGLGRMSGFALSIGLLAIASLAAIPVMIAAEGDRGWGAIALGQAVGAIAAAAIGFGWGVSGPARIAVADEPSRRTAYIESVRARLALFVPIVLATSLAAAAIAPQSSGLAALGAVTAAAAGVSANWYFVGRGAPFSLLLAETLPRVAGTGVGIVLMLGGGGAAAGLAGMLGGMIAAFGCSTACILVSSRHHRASAPRPARLLRILADQRHGMGSALGSAVYIALPVVVVSIVAPAAQPVFALVDKFQRQVGVALQPVITVAQGWVPRRDGAESAARARSVLLVGGGMSLAIGLAVVIAGGAALGWLGNGEIEVVPVAIVLMGLFVAVNFFESLVAKALLPSLGRLRIGAQATLVSTVVVVPLVALGAILWAAPGALGAVVVGLVIRGAVEAGAASRTIRSNRTVIREEIDA